MTIKAQGVLSFELSESGLPSGNYRIAGSFSKGAYLEKPGGGLIMLHDDHWGNIPFGIAVSDCENVLKSADIKESSKASVSDGKLLVSGRASEVEISLARREKALGKSKKPCGEEEFIKVAEEKLHFSHNGVLKNLVSDDFPETAYCITAKKLINGRDIQDALADILGLGPGLTPSGDDLACGYIYYTLRCGKPDEKTKLCIKRILEVMRKLTTAVSCEFLSAAASGAKVTLFDGVCFAKDKEALEKAIDRLLMMGSNSGADVLCGMLLAAKQILRKRL